MDRIKSIKQNERFRMISIFVIGLLVGLFIPKARLVLNLGLLLLIVVFIARHDLRKRKWK